MRLREPFVKKHIHSWKLSSQKLASGGWYFQRTCSEYNCGRTEACYIEHAELSKYPVSLVANADVDWRLGDIDELYPAAEAVFSYFHGLV